MADVAPTTKTSEQVPTTQQAKRQYPVADEQIIAWLVSLVGHAAVSDTAREFARDCHEDLETASCAIAYAEWKYGAPLADRVAAALVPAATAAFEELLAALLRLWLTLYPGALGVDNTAMTVGVA